MSYPIYQNGRFKIIPLTVAFKVVDSEGKVMQTFRPEEIELAVETVDEMAERDGIAA